MEETWESLREQFALLPSEIFDLFKTAFQAKMKLHSGYLDDFSQKGGDSESILKALKIIDSLMLFADEKDLKKLYSVGIHKDVFKYWPNIQEVITELRLIMARGIEVNIPFVLDQTRLYLISVAGYQLVNKCSKAALKDKRVTAIEDAIAPIKRARRRAKGTPRRLGGKDYNFKEAMHGLFDNAANQLASTEFSPDKLFYDVLTGRGERVYLQPLIELGFKYDSTKVSQTDFYNIIYGLFGLMTYLPSYNDYLDSENTYRSFTLYRSDKLKKFIYK